MIIRLPLTVFPLGTQFAILDADEQFLASSSVEGAARFLVEQVNKRISENFGAAVETVEITGENARRETGRL
jgi:hypothetical protein